MYAEILQYAKWLTAEIGFDGFRYDCVKSYNDWIVFAHEGYPCIFWKDYFEYGLGRENTPNGLAELAAPPGGYVVYVPQA